MPWTKVYIDKAEFTETLGQDGLRGLTYVQALHEAQSQAMTADENVFILGEGVDDPGGIFGSTKGLVEQFGASRVFDIAIAENGITGVAIGAALAGMKPIFVHMRMDFLPICLDQIFNHAAKWYYMTGGRVNVPLIIRSIIGRGWGSAAQHSQALHALFNHMPGIKIIAPSTPYDVKGLLNAALDDGNPVLCVEHRWIYDYVGYVPEERYTVPLGQGIVRTQGSDVTVVAISMMVYEAIKAAKELAAEGISVEIIDPRTIKPLDEELIFTSVRKTGRLLIADVACRTGGVGAEIACRVSEEIFDHLKAPVKRINFADVPTPCSEVLEQAFYCSASDIVKAAREVMAHE